MKRILGTSAVVIAMLLSFSGTSLHAIVFTPTTCPTNYTCSLTASGTRPLSGATNDGHPSSIVGVLSFDASSTVSGFLSINSNGTLSSFSLSGATCVSGTGGTLGQIDFTTSAGHALVFDFVTYAAFGGTGLLVADATPNAINGSAVLIGNCINAPSST